MRQKAVFQAILAAVCYGISAPLTKLLLQEIPPVFMAALLYLGAGIGMGIVGIARQPKNREAKINRKDYPYVAAMVILDIAAPVFMMIGLSLTTAATASLMNTFEVAATAVIALVLFKEAVGGRMWISIGLITGASILLSVEDFAGLSVSPGAVFILAACLCWGLENNCTKMLSLKDPLQIVVIKGLGSGLGSLAIAFGRSEVSGNFLYIVLSLVLGFVTYGLSIYFYIRAQREIGAARTSAYYAFAPFVGVLLSVLVFGQKFSAGFGIALVIMIIGSYFAVSEKHSHSHIHKVLEHEHQHNHKDRHHHHFHEGDRERVHSHRHVHNVLEHEHPHMPDQHHIHVHTVKGQ